MKNLKKAISILLILSITILLFPGLGINSYAATPLTLTAYAYDAGTLTVRWPALANTNSIIVSYHTPPNNFSSNTINQSTNTTAISGLQDNFIYDINVKIYNGANGSGTLLGEGFLYFCPRITFISKMLDQQYKDLPGGGRETGITPGLNIKWVIPKVFSTAANDFVYANASNVLLEMQNTINAVYNDGRQLSSFNFRANISTDSATLNSGSTQSSILINQANPEYIANVSGNSLVTAKVHAPDANGFMNFDIIGRQDTSSTVPDPANTYQLKDSDILPGSVYYMNIKPVFYNAGGNTVNAITVGAYTSQNGSTLSGLVPYTYTPIRFQISRDDVNNVYVKVYRVNQGSLDLPGLKYEIQTSDDPTIEGDWKVRKWLNDSFFPNNSPYAVTAFTASSINNLIYYKVVVKTDGSDDRIESLKLPYTLSQDTSRPPVPSSISVIDKVLVPGEVENPLTHQPMTLKSTDVTISWNKPLNWDTLKAESDPNEMLYFHILLSTNQSDIDVVPYPPLDANGLRYGNFPIKYRLVKYFSIKSEDLRENGNHLEYTLKGFDLFKGETYDGSVFTSVDLLNTDKYPTFLLPNKVYYMQMYTATGANKGSLELDKISDKSVPISFTTLIENNLDVPLPKNIRVNKNDAEIVPGPPAAVSNYIELQFDKVNINWNDYTTDPDASKNIYYDLYMSSKTETNTFIRVGSTENPTGDVTFVGTDAQSTSVIATIRDFSSDSTAYTTFGAKLRPNTTYYFMVKSRIVIDDNTIESMFTSILPVTTIIGNITPPDENSRVPLAPTDFAIAKDPSGNQLVSGSTVSFDWTNKESNIKYTLICTSQSIEPDAVPSMYTSDSIYVSFIATFGTDGTVSLDPSNPIADKFEYDNVSKKCLYSIDRWLSPNRLYYFSIRAENKTTKKTSSWVSIPVTTLLIDAPISLEAISDSELALFWTDSDPITKAEDFKISLKGPDDSNYVMLTKSQYTVSKDNSVYYGRILNLKPNTIYNVRIYKGTADLRLILEKIGMKTKDTYHSVEVKWKGLPGYKYELAIKSSEDTNYTTLLDSDLEQYVDKDNHILPYYLEKTPQLSGTNYSYYYAKINTVLITSPTGITQHKPLLSNMKYYIKVRAVKVDALDTTIASYSKYIGPVDIRTEFNQQDYDDTDQDNKKKATFLDKISELEESMFWRVAMSSNMNKLLLKGSKVLNALRNNGRYPYVLDISSLASGTDTDVLYIPMDIIKLLNNEQKSLVIKTSGLEFAMRPNSIDIANSDIINSALNNSTTKDIFFKMILTRSSTTNVSLPSQTKAVSKINNLEIKILACSKNNTDLESQINDKLYNSKTGLVQEKTNIILSSKSGSYLTSRELDEYLDEATGEIESTLSEFINSTIEGSSQVSSMIKTTSTLSTFNDPPTVKLLYNETPGQKAPYVYYNGTTTWQKLSNNVLYADNSLSFPVSKMGKYAALMLQTQANDISENYYASEDINKFRSKYATDDIFGNSSSFYPESPVSVKETILLFEKVSGKTVNNSGLDIRQKCTSLGLDSIISSNNALKDIERQELAGILANLYTSKMGISLDSLSIPKNITIKDESSISSKYYKPVLVCLDSGILTLKEQTNFVPTGPITRAEVITALVKLLELAGEM